MKLEDLKEGDLVYISNEAWYVMFHDIPRIQRVSTAKDGSYHFTSSSEIWIRLETHNVSIRHLRELTKLQRLLNGL